MTAQPLRAAHPLPAHVSLVCPCCEEAGGFTVYDLSDYAGTRGRWLGCDECDGSGRLTLYLGYHEGQLHGFVAESQTLGIFGSVRDAYELNWLHSWKANPRHWADDAALEALHVAL